VLVETKSPFRAEAQKEPFACPERYAPGQEGLGSSSEEGGDSEGGLALTRGTSARYLVP
jgi:hypothetical protein